MATKCTALLEVFKFISTSSIITNRVVILKRGSLSSKLIRFIQYNSTYFAYCALEVLNLLNLLHAPSVRYQVDVVQFIKAQLPEPTAFGIYPPGLQYATYEHKIRAIYSFFDICNQNLPLITYISLVICNTTAVHSQRVDIVPLCRSLIAVFYLSTSLHLPEILMHIIPKRTTFLSFIALHPVCSTYPVDIVLFQALVSFR